MRVGHAEDASCPEPGSLPARLRSMPQMHKGDRVYTPTRLHTDLAAILRKEAQAQRVPVGDLVAAAVAEHYGRPDLGPPLPRTSTPELPMTG